MVLNMYIDKIMRNVYKKSSSKKYLNFGKFKKHFCNTIYYHLCQKFVFFILFKIESIYNGTFLHTPHLYIYLSIYLMS
jgi:hypothetical protein